VQTQFGWHVIQLDDVRTTQFPPFETVKQQMVSRMQEQEVQKLVRELRAKAKIE
jgi:peptidyl-prolyl cis-trans isomerase C